MQAPQSPEQSVHYCWNPFKDTQKDLKPTGWKTMMDQRLREPYLWTMHPKHSLGTHSSWPQDNLENEIFFLFLLPVFTTLRFQQ